MAGPEDDFDAYFDQLSKMKDDANPPTDFGAPIDPNAPVVVPVADPVADPVVDPPAAIVPVADPVVDPVVVPPADNTELLTRLADLLDKRAPAPVFTPAAPPQQQPIYTAEEIAEINAVERDFPDIVRAVGLLMKGHAIENKAALYNELGPIIGQQQTTLQTVAGSHQLNELRRMIPDYDAVRDPVIAWATDEKKQPDYLRTAFASVINTGDARQITDMVNRWRQETGAPAAPTSGHAVPPKSAAGAPELSPAVKQAAAAMAPVTSKRTTTAPSEPVDFDSAFKAFADLKD